MSRPIAHLRNPRSPEQLLVARLTLVTLATLAIDLVTAFVFLLLEKDADGSDIHNYEQSLFWTTSQLTSVSSSLSNPVTTGGHVVALGIDVLAVGVVTLLIATIAQHMHVISPTRADYARAQRRRGGGSKSSRSRA